MLHQVNTLPGNRLKVSRADDPVIFSIIARVGISEESNLNYERMKVVSDSYVYFNLIAVNYLQNVDFLC